MVTTLITRKENEITTNFRQNKQCVQARKRKVITG